MTNNDLPSAPKLGDTRIDPKGVPQVYVPAGRFLMGSTRAQLEDSLQQANQYNKDVTIDWFIDQAPQHEVRITRGFWLDQFPVTNAYFQSFMDDGGYQEDRWWSKGGLQWRRENNVLVPEDYVLYIEDPNQPRVGINWYEAEAYANWRGGHLPTEAEWEYAARGEQSLIYPWGNEYESTRLNAENQRKKTSPVDMYPDGKSWCGAFDLAGNVWEWCADWFAADFYAQCVSNNWIDDPFCGESQTDSVLRGGSFGSDPFYCRSAYRVNTRIFRDDDRGCRVVSAVVSVA
ncbi:MAG: formylglycine-generating enzyme family protein [Anaerolineae bacterium]|nr:formylglycine-generating enzyme family protein [Anaerolineae bacterium]